VRKRIDGWGSEDGRQREREREGMIEEKKE